MLYSIKGQNMNEFCTINYTISARTLEVPFVANSWQIVADFALFESATNPNKTTKNRIKSTFCEHLRIVANTIQYSINE